MNIVFAINKGFVQHCTVVLKSLEINILDGEKLTIHIMFNNLVKEDIKLIESTFNKFLFKWYDLKEYDFSDFYINAHINYETYFRILVPEIISEDKVLYLDSDLIVRKSVGDLYNENIESFAGAAVYDHKAQERKRHLTIPEEYSYFNAGVLLMNLKYWRQNNLSAKLIQYIKDMGSKLVYWDQDALNALLYNEILIVNNKWNVQTASFEVGNINNEILQDPAIIHFTGASKPWHISNENIFKDEYYKYLQCTPFNDFKMLKRETQRLIESKNNIFILGAGPTGKSVYEFLGINIKGFIDSNVERIGSKFLNHTIYSIEQIVKTESVGIIVCSGHFKEITKLLIEYGYTEGKDFVHQM